VTAEGGFEPSPWVSSAVSRYSSFAWCGAASSPGVVGDDDGRLAVLQHHRDALGGVAGIERHVGAAGLQDPQQAHHHLDRALQVDPHHHVGPDAQRLQLAGDPVGVLVQLAVGQALPAEGDGHGVGRAGRLLLEELVHAGLPGELGLGGVPLPQRAASATGVRGSSSRVCCGFSAIETRAAVARAIIASARCSLTWAGSNDSLSSRSGLAVPEQGEGEVGLLDPGELPVGPGPTLLAHGRVHERVVVDDDAVEERAPFATSAAACTSTSGVCS
jgi:hypothetical protein